MLLNIADFVFIYWMGYSFVDLWLWDEIILISLCVIFVAKKKFVVKSHNSYTKPIEKKAPRNINICNNELNKIK